MRPKNHQSDIQNDIAVESVIIRRAIAIGSIAAVNVPKTKRRISSDSGMPIISALMESFLRAVSKSVLMTKLPVTNTSRTSLSAAMMMSSKESAISSSEPPILM